MYVHVALYIYSSESIYLFSKYSNEYGRYNTSISEAYVNTIFIFLAGLERLFVHFEFIHSEFASITYFQSGTQEFEEYCLSAEIGIMVVLARMNSFTMSSTTAIYFIFAVTFPVLNFFCRQKCGRPCLTVKVKVITQSKQYSEPQKTRILNDFLIIFSHTVISTCYCVRTYL